MDKDKLSPKEEALLAEARRESQARKDAPAATAVPRPAVEAKPAPTAAEAKPAPAAADAKPSPTAAERLAELMAEEREATQEKKRKMRRYGITISGAIFGVFTLWALWSLRRRR